MYCAAAWVWIMSDFVVEFLRRMTSPVIQRLYTVVFDDVIIVVVAVVAARMPTTMQLRNVEQRVTERSIHAA